VEPSTNGEAARGRCHSFTVAAHVLAAIRRGSRRRFEGRAVFATGISCVLLARQRPGFCFSARRASGDGSAGQGAASRALE